jgi:nitrite reductase (NADH) small subunit
MSATATQTTQARQGAEDAGRYFKYMAEFVGLTQAHADAIKESRYVIEKHIPNIVTQFYSNLLDYAPTRKIFQKKDGTIDLEYLQLRMHHLGNFWRRTASGVYGDDYARFVDYVGRAHTSHGADPNIYIPERYVIGQVGLVQHAIAEALHAELDQVDPDLAKRAAKAWNMLMMVILEMLARAYHEEHEAEVVHSQTAVSHEAVHQLAVATYERDLGLFRSIEHKDVLVARADDIPDGERKIVQVDDLSIGIFCHNGNWYALRNSCLHRGGPVATGCLEGNVITCPWHGYQYNVTNGELLLDPRAKLALYPVTVRDGDIYLRVPVTVMDAPTVSLNETPPAPAQSLPLKENEFRVADVKPGQIKLVHLNGQRVAVYNISGKLYATQEECTHADGPLSEGDLKKNVVVCPWHDSCFDVTTGQVLEGPATEPLKTFRVIVEGDVARVE